MALTIKTLAADEFPAGAPATTYTVPGATKTRLTELWVSNNAAAPRTFAVWIVNSGDGGGDDNQLIHDMNAPQDTPLIFPLNTLLDTGDFIRVDASAADVAYRISGIEEA